ncbi:MAG: translation initiation factor IF-2 [Verrucomicrobiota bacterium]|nr:translation initiation factor IF-2 [Verrucomicrobiota bacterium]
MSVRIYQLSKEIGMENTDLLDILRERGFQVKSASSTIDNISAESIKEEFASEKSEPASKAESVEEVAEAAPVAPPSPASFVRTKDEIEQEKEAAKEAAAAKSAPTRPPKPSPAAPPPPVSAPASAPPPPPDKTSGPVSVSPPPAGPAKAAPPPPPSRMGPASIAPPPAPSAAGEEASTDDAKVEAAAQDSGEIRTIVVKPPIVVRDLAAELGIKPFKLISDLMEMGIFASINQSLEEDVASKLAEKRGIILEIRHRGEGPKANKKKEVKEVDESALLEERPAVVCILGHVDHGKTSLLDYIRKESVVSKEAGGITQHIGAYQVDHNDKKITFLDTPGHAAFNQMRARGADVTDVAVLIVAADDGFMPQTDEALKFIQKAGVQPIVAINKIDTQGANIDRVKTQMQERGIPSEDWGGETITVPISALKGDGIEDLLDMILLQTEVLELKANPKKAAEGVIIEGQVEIGRGPTATVIVQAGTLKIGDCLVCGPHFTKVKALFNEYGKNLKAAPPSTPVRIIGWSGVPDCGATFHAAKNEKAAKREAEENTILQRADQKADQEERMPTSQEKLFAAIAANQKKTLRLIVKGDVYGSVEAIKNALTEIHSDKVALYIVRADVGPVSKSDVQKASAGATEIIGFNVKSENGVQALAKHHAVKITHHKIIYELIDQVRDDMVGMLDPEFRENKIGAAEVRAVFPIAKGFVAGCLVVEGRVVAQGHARLIRNGEVVAEQKIDSLRRVKDEVKEVRAGTECGIHLENTNDYKEGDLIEIYEIHEIRPEL